MKPLARDERWRAAEGQKAAKCVGKQAFDSPKFAHERAAIMRRRDKAVNVYRCDLCGFWHIGGRAF